MNALQTSRTDDELSRRLAALGHPARIGILRHLACDDGRCCKDVVGVLDLAQSTVSQHLKVLVEAGLVDLSIEGKRSRYCLNRTALAALKVNVESLFSACTAPGCAGAPPHQPE
ncbi:MAG: helix-turn-helix transcriptional regulator [Phyllobacteriaceae bacterium]|nr:helix-turn-helix transcriptional regulator [Phyllobacteriaceae bacterium]